MISLIDSSHMFKYVKRTLKDENIKLSCLDYNTSLGNIPLVVVNDKGEYIFVIPMKFKKRYDDDMRVLLELYKRNVFKQIAWYFKKINLPLDLKWRVDFIHLEAVDLSKLEDNYTRVCEPICEYDSNVKPRFGIKAGYITCVINRDKFERLTKK